MLNHEEIWKSLSALCSIRFSYNGQADEIKDYSSIERIEPQGICICSTEYEWDQIRFTAKKEYFGVPNNTNLLIFRHTTEPFSNCDFDLESSMPIPAEGSVWEVEEVIEQENNSCGLLLKHKDGFRIILAETSQVTSVSLRVDEKRKGTDRFYHLTAFEECPIRIEKYISMHTDEEEDYIEKAFLECRNASKIRFDDLKGTGAWEPSKETVIG
ncbi:MAG: hypothetical protein Q4B22_08545 [Eubacteriales bacterium]|nr:hypothetical protein [Eubacteriales bacterium]